MAEVVVLLHVFETEGQSNVQKLLSTQLLNPNQF